MEWPSNTRIFRPFTASASLTPLAGYEPFFGTNFTYQDLGFVPLGGRGEKLLGTEPHKAQILPAEVGSKEGFVTRDY